MSKRVPSTPPYVAPPSPSPVMGPGLVQANIERKLAYRAFAAHGSIDGESRPMTESSESVLAAIAAHVHATYGNKG